MPDQSRLSDTSKISADAHGCPACPHCCIGPAITGSPNVFVNSLPALRDTDMGVHAACCDGNLWLAVGGSGSVFINSLAAHRKDDDDQHCGGMGAMTVGSPNVHTGG